MNRTERMELAKQYGMVKVDGWKYWLTEQAYVSNYGTDGAVRYYAHAIDRKNDHYRIAWNTTTEWDRHQAEEDQDIKDAHGDEHCCAFCQDESNACDWDAPIAATSC